MKEPKPNKFAAQIARDGGLTYQVDGEPPRWVPLPSARVELGPDRERAREAHQGRAPSMMTGEQYQAAREALERATAHADEIARREGWQRGEGVWSDLAHDHLYDARAELGSEVYAIALELLAEGGPR